MYKNFLKRQLIYLFSFFVCFVLGFLSIFVFTGGEYNLFFAFGIVFVFIGGYGVIVSSLSIFNNYKIVKLVDAIVIDGVRSVFVLSKIIKSSKMKTLRLLNKMIHKGIIKGFVLENEELKEV